MVASISAIYSGALSTSSPIFIRPNANMGFYHYQAIELEVIMSGMYSFTSNSAVDMYGCLYDYSFDSPDLNQWLAADDDSGNDQQFYIIYQLQQFQKYILVVTTYNYSDTGSYIIRMFGPAKLILTSITWSTSSPLRTSSK